MQMQRPQQSTDLVEDEEEEEDQQDQHNDNQYIGSEQDRYHQSLIRSQELEQRRLEKHAQKLQRQLDEANAKISKISASPSQARSQITMDLQSMSKRDSTFAEPKHRIFTGTRDSTAQPNLANLTHKTSVSKSVMSNHSGSLNDLDQDQVDADLALYNDPALLTSYSHDNEQMSIMYEETTALIDRIATIVAALDRFKSSAHMSISETKTLVSTVSSWKIGEN